MYSVNILLIRTVYVLFIGTFMVTLSGCVSTSYTDSDGVDQIYHGFALEVDRSIKTIQNFRYIYGVLGGNEFRKGASSPGHFTSAKLSMPIPDYFEIAWETLDGVSHQAKVPVKGHLPAAANNKTVSFVIMYDSVQGYLERYTPTGIERTRFY